jgi:hypothetical protein
MMLESATCHCPLLPAAAAAAKDYKHLQGPGIIEGTSSQVEQDPARSFFCTLLEQAFSQALVLLT